MKQFKFIDLMALRDHMSVSFITDMLSCSMKGVLKGVLKLDAPNKSRSPALLKGSIMHKILECYFLKIQAREITDSQSMLELSIDEALKYYEGKRKFYDSKVLDEAIDFFKSSTQVRQSLADFLAINFLSKAAIADKFVKTEMAFSKTPVCGFNFDGRINLVFDDEVIDFKTTSKNMANSPDPAKRAQALQKIKRECALQLVIYKHALAQLNIENMPMPKYFSIIEIIFTKQVPINYYKFTSEEVEESAKELLDRIEIVKDILKHNKIYRNYRDTMCPCEFSQYCMDEANLNMILSKLTLPKNFF